MNNKQYWFQSTDDKSNHLDVVGYNRDILEVKGSIYLVHDIQRRRFVMVQSKYLGGREEGSAGDREGGERREE